MVEKQSQRDPGEVEGGVEGEERTEVLSEYHPKTLGRQQCMACSTTGAVRGTRRVLLCPSIPAPNTGNTANNERTLF